MSSASSSPPNAEPAAKSRPWWVLAVKIFVVALVLWGIHRAVGQAIEELHELAWRPRNMHWGTLALAAVVYLAGLTPAGVFWWLILRKLGQRPGLLPTLWSYFIGHLGKYVPGKALVVILRAGLLKGHGVDTGIAAAAVFCETLTMMAVGAFVGGGVVLILFRQQTWLAILAVGLMLGAGVPTVPPLFARLARLAGVGKRSPEIVDRLAHLDYATLACGWLLNLIGWTLVGGSLLLVFKATGLPDSNDLSSEWMVCVGAAALAVVAGFASLIPGGFGVREAVLLVLLVPTFGKAGALVATIVARLVWLVAEVVISIILYTFGRPPAAADYPPAPDLPL